MLLALAVLEAGSAIGLFPSKYLPSCHVDAPYSMVFFPRCHFAWVLRAQQPLALRAQFVVTWAQQPLALRGVWHLSALVSTNATAFRAPTMVSPSFYPILALTVTLLL